VTVVTEPHSEPSPEPFSENTADVIVVGAGPAGSTTAYHLAKSGLDVLLLEKTEFPREKVCGDGLTPRATKQLVAMGIDISEEAGWLRNKGLRIIGGGVRLQLDWPDLASFPDYGLVRKRDDFDEQLARQAQKAGARVVLVGMRLPPNYGPHYTEDFESAYPEVAKRYRTALVPFLLEDFSEKEDFFQPDRIHPTEEAQPLMMEQVWKALQPVLKSK